MIGLFKQKSPANIVILLIFGLLIKMPLFLYPRAITITPEDAQLYQFILSLLSSTGTSNAFPATLFSFGLLYVQALMINYLVNEHRMTARQTFLPAMAYLMLTSLVPEWSYLSAPLLVSTFILWSVNKLFRLYNVPASNGIIFNIGLLLGICTFIYFPSIGFIVCLLLGLMILKPFKINEWVLLALGIITPYYFYCIYLFLNDQLLLKNIFPQFTFQVPHIQSTIWIAIAVLLIGLPFLLGGYYIQNQLRKMLIQVRKYWSILLFYLLLTLVIPFISSTASIEDWVIAAAPFAAFHASTYFYPQKQALPLFLFFATLLFILLQQYGTDLWHH